MKSKNYIILGIVTLLFSCSKQGTIVNVEEERAIKAQVLMTTGEVKLLKPSDPLSYKLIKGDWVGENDCIITGRDGKVNLILENIGLISIAPQSKVVLSSLKLNSNNAIDQKIDVKTGKIILGLKKLKKESSFNVNTPIAVVGVRGTSFVVEVGEEIQNAFPFFVQVGKNKKITVGVFSGVVNVESANKSTNITPMKMAVIQGTNLKIKPIERVYLNDLNEIKQSVPTTSSDLNSIFETINIPIYEIPQPIAKPLGLKKFIVKRVLSSNINVSNNVSGVLNKIEKIKTLQNRNRQLLDAGDGF